MEIIELQHNCDHFFLNGDFVSLENYVIINDRKEIFRNGKLFEIEGDYSLGFPKIKIISNEQFILIDCDKPITSYEKIHNAWIINGKGKIEKSFYLGVVHQIINTQNYLICSYTDCGLDTNWQYAQNGLVVFDFHGNSKFEYYRDEAKHKWLNFLENYAFLEKDEETIYYMPYPHFPIVEFSLRDFSSKVLFHLPKYEELKSDSFWMPKAFSKKGNDWFFITPNIDRLYSRIFKMDSKMNIEEIGKCCFSLFPKGMKGGQFFVPFSGGHGTQRQCQYIKI